MRLEPSARLGFLLLLCATLAWETAAVAAQSGKSAMVVLRGPEPSSAATTRPLQPAAPAPANRSLDPSLAPTLSPDWSSSPRVGGYSAAAGGGARCRTSCAQDYYACRAGPDDEDCGSRWSQCLTACPSQSADADLSGY